MDTIQTAHKLTFKMNMDLAVQQTRSQMVDAFTFETELKGKKAQFIELYGSTTAVRNLGRKADTPDIDSQVEPVWVTPEQLAWGKLMELEDVIKNVMDPQSKFIQAGAAAMERGKDEILAAAVFGQRRIGEDGATLSSWAGQTVGVGVGFSATDDTSPAPMNVKKILRLRRYLSADKIDLRREQVFVSLNAQQQEELFRDLTFISADYRNKKPLDSPEDLNILGVTIMPANDGSAGFADFDGTTYTAAGWCKSGMHWGQFEPRRDDIPLRPDKLMRPHPQSEEWIGASRSEDKKVVKILSKK